MAAVDLPHPCSHTALITAFNTAGVLEGAWDRLVIRIPDPCFIETAAIAFLCAWGLQRCQEQRRLVFMGNAGTLRYLARMDLFAHLGFDYPETFERHAEEGRFITLRLVEDDQAVFQATNAVCDLVLRQFDDARAFLPALEWAVNEIIDNIGLHSQSPVPGAVCAQYFPQRHRLDIGICDVGRGIKASLGESIFLWSHGDAVTKALQRGITRNRAVGQGNGLAGCHEIVRQNGGNFHVWTGDVDYHASERRERGDFSQIPPIAGTGLFLRLDTHHPVDLGQTFIGESTWSYIDAESIRVQDRGGLRIRDECFHTGTRAPAATLRRKIMAILPDYDGPLILDFDGVETATSSFLDELLGRLAEHLGERAFGEKIKLVNISKLLLDMANVVIHQRLAGAE